MQWRPFLGGLVPTIRACGGGDWLAGNEPGSVLFDVHGSPLFLLVLCAGLERRAVDCNSSCQLQRHGATHAPQPTLTHTHKREKVREREREAKEDEDSLVTRHSTDSFCLVLLLAVSLSLCLQSHTSILLLPTQDTPYCYPTLPISTLHGRFLSHRVGSRTETRAGRTDRTCPSSIKLLRLLPVT